MRNKNLIKNSGHKHVFCGWDFYSRLPVQASTSFNYRYVASFFFEFGVVIVEYFVYKRVFGFPPFCLYYFFMKLFLFQSKTKNAVNDINQNFTSNNLNKKKSEHPFLKKLIFEHLTLSMISFESFMRRWSSSK